MATPTGTADVEPSGPEPLIRGHRPDIEGLRAVAVIAVLLYHAGVPGLDGGYVGVDVFFVLSGYLMTALLVAEQWSSGSISMRGFYARRARRLLPASVLVLLVTLVAAWLILTPLAFERAATDTMAAGGYVVNLRFAGAATSYLAGDIDASPVLHYWSLAVEEQFYLVWPVLLGLALGKGGRRAAPVALLTVISVASFTLSVAWTSRIQPWAFFSLPTRAWEFGVGGLTALLAGDLGRRLGGAWHAGIAWIGAGLVVGSVVLFDDSTSFPGPAAVVPVFGTAAILLAGPHRHGSGGLLAAWPLQWIGSRSYGIYLWHWPPLVLVPVLARRELHVAENLLLVAGSVALAAITLRWVENPLRYSRRLTASRLRSGLLAAALTLAAVGLPWLGRSMVDVRGAGVAQAISRTALSDPVRPVPVPADLQPSLRAVGHDTPGDLYVSGCHVEQLGTEPLLPCAYGTVDAPRTIVLFGDSHMAQWFPAFEQLGIDDRVRIVSLTKSACPSIDISVYNVNFERPYDECDTWRSATMAAIIALEPDAVVLANYPRPSSGYPDDDGTDFMERWLAALARTTESLRATGAQVVVLAPTPVPPYDVPDCVSGELVDSRPCDLERAEVVSADRLAGERAVAASSGAHYLDMTDWFCGPTICPVIIGPYLVYRDESHVTTPYMHWLAASLADVWDVGGFFDEPRPRRNAGSNTSP